MSNLLNPIITAAGIQASFNATNDGLQVKITEVALGQGAWVPTSAATTLQDEVKRVPIEGSERIADDQIHITAIDPAGGTDYWIREVGFYLEDGTLFAVWSSDTQPLGFHSASSDFAISLDWKISSVPVDSIEVVGTGGFSFAPATTERRGVVRLYSSDANSPPDAVLTKQDLDNLTNGAPGALDTLNELAAALGDDPNFAATITAALGTKLSMDDINNGDLDTRYHRKNEWSASLAAPGYQKLPSGLILQWGTVSQGADHYSRITFPIAFPNAGLFATGYHIGTGAALAIEVHGTFTATGIVMRQFYHDGVSSPGWFLRWMAIGY